MSAVPPLMPGSLNLSTLEVDKAKIRTIMGDVLGTLNTWKGTVRLIAITAVVSLSGLPVIDGVQTVVGDRVLLAGEPNVSVTVGGVTTTTNANGIYTVSTLAWKQVADLPVGTHAAGIAVFVSEGLTGPYADTLWVCTSDAPNDVVGTNNLAFSSTAAPTNSVGIAGAVQMSAGVGAFADSTMTAVAGLLTVPAGISITTVGVTADVGNITATTGDVVVDAGNITATLGAVQGVSVTDGVATMTLGGLAGVTTLVTSGQTDLATSGTLGLFGATAVVQPATLVESTVIAAGAGTAILADTTSDGGLGGSAYTLGAVVLALKQLGALAA